MTAKENLTGNDKTFIEMLRQIDYTSSHGAAFFAILCAASAKTSAVRAAEIEEELPEVFGTYTQKQLHEACDILDSFYVEYLKAEDELHLNMVTDAYNFIQEYLLDKE